MTFINNFVCVGVFSNVKSHYLVVRTPQKIIITINLIINCQVNIKVT